MFILMSKMTITVAIFILSDGLLRHVNSCKLNLKK